MRKNLIVIAMVTVILTGMMGASITASSSIFKDVSTNDWYYSCLKYAYDKEIMVGDRGMFYPNDSITAAEFIKTMVVALQGEDTIGDSMTGHWATLYIQDAKDKGLVKDGEFSNYDLPINRGLMARICDRTLELLEGSYDYQYRYEIESYVPDNGDIQNSGVANYIYNMYERGILEGHEDGSFKPGDNLTRAEATTVIMKILEPSERTAFEPKEMSLDAKVLTETYGYEPFAHSGDNDTVYDIYQDGSYCLESGLDFWNDTNADQEVKHDFLICYSMGCLEGTSVEIENYELRLILKDIIKVDDTTIDEVMDYITSKTDNHTILHEKYFENSKGRSFKVEKSDWGMRIIYIRGFED